jgi:hypothetical protein
MTKVKLVLVVICVAVAFGVIAAQERAKRETMDVCLGLRRGRLPIAQGNTADKRDEGRFSEAQAGRERGLALDFGK